MAVAVLVLCCTVRPCYVATSADVACVVRLHVLLRDCGKESCHLCCDGECAVIMVWP